jgi:hypothetical protein
VSGGRNGGDLGVDEAIITALLLLTAGHETTANLIGNAIAALCQAPELARSLRSNVSMVPRSIEEFLRYDSPVQLTARVCTEGAVLDGCQLSEGSRMLVSLGGANRDPLAFPDPDHLDFKRSGTRHLAFGHGAHFCAGAALARAETQVLLTELLRMDPPLESRGVALNRGRSRTFRRIESLTLSK